MEDHIILAWLISLVGFGVPLGKIFHRAGFSAWWGLLGLFSFAMSLIFAVAITNLNSSRPHIGQHGYWRLIELDWPFVIGNTIKSLVVAVPFILCLESVGRGFWSLFRRFKE